MEKAKVEQLEPGNRIFCWWDSGAMGAEPMVLTVVRVNRKTVTIRNSWDEVGRIPHDEVAGLVDWEDVVR